MLEQAKSGKQTYRQTFLHIKLYMKKIGQTGNRPFGIESHTCMAFYTK